MAFELGRALTSTEIVIADLAARGKRNDEIAAELGLSPRTIEWHLSRVYRKLRIRSRTELAALAASGGNPWAAEDAN